MKKQRLDDVLIHDGIVKNKQEAFVAVTEGKIFVDGQKAVSPAQPISTESEIKIRSSREYVGRGAYKLEAALREFRISVTGKTCADIGSATGGFTEVLLKYGAEKVYAIDTAKGKLAPKIRENPRVVVMERTDVRNIDSLPDLVDIVTVDISLIPLEQILPHARRFLKETGSVVALFKPQYQTRNPKILKHGILKNKTERKKLLESFMEWAMGQNWKIIAQKESPILGSKGNIEYLLYLKV